MLGYRDTEQIICLVKLPCTSPRGLWYRPLKLKPGYRPVGTKLQRLRSSGDTARQLFWSQPCMRSNQKAVSVATRKHHRERHKHGLAGASHPSSNLLLTCSTASGLGLVHLKMRTRPSQPADASILLSCLTAISATPFCFRGSFVCSLRCGASAVTSQQHSWSSAAPLKAPAQGSKAWQCNADQPTPHSLSASSCWQARPFQKPEPLTIMASAGRQPTFA